MYRPSLRRTRSAPYTNRQELHELPKGPSSDRRTKSAPCNIHSCGITEKIGQQHGVTQSHQPDEAAQPDTASMVEGEKIEQQPCGAPQCHGVTQSHQSGGAAQSDTTVVAEGELHAVLEVQEILEENEPQFEGVGLLTSPMSQSPLPIQIQSHPSAQPQKFGIFRLLAILGATITGYATSFLGGVFNGYIFLYNTFPHLFYERRHAKSTDFCGFADFRFLLLASAIPLSACVSLWVAFALSKWRGRKVVLLSGSILQFIGLASIILLPRSPVVILGLIMEGFGIGFLIQVIPTIFAELVPKIAHKQLGILFGYQCVGAALAFGTNFLLASHPLAWSWRISFGVLEVLVLMLFVASLTISETPRYLLEQGKVEEAHNALRRLRDGYLNGDIEAEWGELINTTRDDEEKNQLQELLRYENHPALIIKTFAQLLPQLGTTVPPMFFGPLVSKSISSISNVQFITPFAAGFLGVIITLLASAFLCKARKRRSLLIGSSIFVLASQVGLWMIFTFFVDPYVNLKKDIGLVTALLFVINFVGVSVLINPHGWINCPMSGGQFAAAWLNFVAFGMMMAIQNIVSIKLLCIIKGWMFLMDGVFALFMVFFIYYLVPETTRVDENMAIRLVWGPHWFWRRYIA